MNNFFKHLITVWLFAPLVLSVQSCTDQIAPVEKRKVQFSFNAEDASSARVVNPTLPENARLRVSIETSSGAATFSNHDLQIFKVGNGYIADPLELEPGSYVVTDFMVVKDSDVLFASPKRESKLGSLITNSLPYNFSVTESSSDNVSIKVMDVKGKDPEAFGYASFNLNVVNTLTISAYASNNGRVSLTNATAELRQGKTLINTFSLNASKNTIALEGDPNKAYTLLVYNENQAKATTFTLADLKKLLRGKEFKIILQPALILKISSSVDEANEYEEFFDFQLDGTGSVNINWGDGSADASSLPYSGLHEYTVGDYTAIITGNINQITNLYGFSYGSVILGINGLTNATALKTYNPSWGAVPIKVNLSKCNALETIYVEKYGAPYEPIDLRTDFKLPTSHNISEFVFIAPSFDITREYMSAEELAVMVKNIYDNTTTRGIYGGRFMVTPVNDISPESQAMLDILETTYSWDVRFNDEIYEYDDGARTRTNDLEARRDQWLKSKFPKRERKSKNVEFAFNN